MKRFFLACGLVIALLVSGCGLSSTSTSSSSLESSSLSSSTHTLTAIKGWYFQYNDGSNDYSLLFGLADENDELMSTDVDVGIRIVNDMDEEVYMGTKFVSADDFRILSYPYLGDRLLADVRIPASEIKAGKSASGKVYFTVYKEYVGTFGEANCDALFLPIEDIQVKSDLFPLDIEEKDYWGNIESTIQINGAEYKFDKDYLALTITIIGQKKGAKSESGFDLIGYKLYDSEGYMINAGTIYLPSLSDGDKFKDSSVVIYDITPGETYTFRLFESDR